MTRKGFFLLGFAVMALVLFLSFLEPVRMKRGMQSSPTTIFNRTGTISVAPIPFTSTSAISPLNSSLEHPSSSSVAVVVPPKKFFTLHWCGWNRRALFQELFPDAQLARRPYHPNATMTASDIIILGSNCIKGNTPHTTPAYFQRQFPGKALFINSQSWSLENSVLLDHPNLFEIGGAITNGAIHHSLRVVFVAIFLVQAFEPAQWPKIMDPSQKPKNNG
jgi:hypothetical protein